MALEHVCSFKVNDVGLLHHWGARGWRKKIDCLCLNKLYILQIGSAPTNTLQEQYSQHSSETFLIQTAQTPKYSKNLKPQRWRNYLGLCVFKLLPNSSSPAAFLHLTSLRRLLSFLSPRYVKTNWQAGVWTMLWAPKQSPTPLRADLDCCNVRSQFPEIVCVILLLDWRSNVIQPGIGLLRPLK